MPDTAAPLVSIITPAYNHEAFIGDCLRSVGQQTYTHWEQIIVDDGSLDGTAKIVAGFRDPRILYRHQPNQGAFELAQTYNRALGLARGDLIAILEGDDLWPPDKLAALVPAFQQDNVVLAYGDRSDVDEHGRRQRRRTATNRLRQTLPYSVLQNDPVGAATRHMLLAEGRSLIGPCTVMIRRSALEQIGGFQYVAGLPLTDYPTFLQLSLVGRFAYFRQTLGYLRRHNASVTARHARTIHDAVSIFTREFLQTFCDRVALSPAERAELENNWREAGQRLHFSEGRLLLLRENWSEARAQFFMASRSKSAKVRAAAWAGLLLSWAHLNMEPLMKLGGRSDMRSPRAGGSSRWAAPASRPVRS